MENQSQSNSEQNPSSRLLAIVTDALEDAKAKDITTLDVSHLTSVTDALAICTGTSNRHLKTIAETAMSTIRQAGFEVLGHEGEGVSEWVVVDLGDVVLHVMSPQARAFYNLEGLWAMDSASQDADAATTDVIQQSSDRPTQKPE